MRAECCFLAHSTPQRQSVTQNVIKVLAGAPRVSSQSPGSIDLTGDLILAHTHGIETATHAEGMGERSLIKKAIETRPFLELEVIFGGEQAEYGIDRQSWITPDNEFSPVEGGIDEQLLDAFSLRQHGEDFGLTASAHPEAFSDFNSGRPVIQADYNKRRFRHTLLD